MNAVRNIADLPEWPFGDSPALADRLAALIVAGVKTATCSALSQDAWSPPGERGVLVDGKGKPVAILEIETSEHLPFCDITPEQARLEGEGDLSFDYWRDAHREYFSRNGGFSETMPVVFETFRLVEILDAGFAENAGAHVEAERAGQTL